LLDWARTHSDVPERFAEMVERAKGVFHEIPGTQLSIAQASRLAGIELSLCESVISALEDARVLKRTRDGRYLYRGIDAPHT
jgi:hypothetical protein